MVLSLSSFGFLVFEEHRLDEFSCGSNGGISLQFSSLVLPRVSVASTLSSFGFLLSANVFSRSEVFSMRAFTLYSEIWMYASEDIADGSNGKIQQARKPGLILFSDISFSHASLKRVQKLDLETTTPG